MYRTILICLLFLITTTITYGQEIKKGVYIQDSGLAKFEGTWVGTKGKDTLFIKFTERKVHFEGPDVYVDLILGWHSYTSKNRVIVDKLHQFGEGKDTATLRGGSNSSNPDILNLTFNDPNRESILRANFKINSSKGILKFEKPANFNWLTFFKGKKESLEAGVLPIPSTWKMNKVE